MVYVIEGEIKRKGDDQTPDIHLDTKVKVWPDGQEIKSLREVLEEDQKTLLISISEYGTMSYFTADRNGEFMEVEERQTWSL